MNIRYILLLTIIVGFWSCKPKEEPSKPNIIYILADDLGYGELGIYGQEKIETPHIDQLGKEGLKFTQHYSGAPVCAPARSVFLTGLHSGHTPIRGNHEWGERGDVWNFAKAVEDPNLEGQFPMPENTQTIAKMLKKAGYATGMVGKWGLGGPLSHSVPTKMGFDYFNGYNCQRQAHTYYPKHLWENEEKIYLKNKLVASHTKLAENANPLLDSSYRNFNLTDYAPDIMHTAALSFIEKNKNIPFFLYYASPIPHVPLQAPERWVKYYEEKFGEEEPYFGNRGYFPTRSPRATYAAMVSYLDEQVGEIVSKLKELDIYENSVIVFASDNGPSYNGGTDSEFFNSAGPFKSEYGWGKGFVKEGGIRVPLIFHWKDKIKPGNTDYISAFYDMMPTFADFAGATTPTTDGLSMKPLLTGSEGEQKNHEFLYWEFPAQGGHQAVRMGKWKAIRSNILNEKKEIKFELFNLKEDPTESTDISGSHPDIVSEIMEIMKTQHEEPEIDRFKMPALSELN